MLSSQRQVYITTIILGVIITASGFWFFSFVAAKVKDQNRISLEAIASLKVRQIKTWFDDELSDLRIISGNLSDQAFHSAKDLQGIETDDYTVGLLSNIANEHNYYEILITGLDGDVIISSSGANGILSSEELQAGLKAAEDMRSHSSDFFKAGTGKEGKVLCSFICLINDSLGKGVGLVIARVDVAEPLFNAIESWPVPSVSAESYLFKLEGDCVLYLDRLLKRTDTAMWYRKPASTADLKEAMAIKGQPGFYSGKDYDNTRVVAYISAIEGSPWFLSSKIDRAELLKGLGLSGFMAGGLAICLVLLSLTSVSLIYIRRQRSIIEELYENDRNLLLEQAKFKTIMEEIGVGIVVTDLLYRISYLNPFAERVSGWSIGESQGKSFNDIFLIRYEDTEKEILLEEISLSDDRGLLGQKYGNCTLISRMGEKIPVSDLVVRYAGGLGLPEICIITFNDITEKKIAEQRLHQNEQVLKSILETQQDLICRFRPDTSLTFVNSAFCRLYGLGVSEIVGKRFLDFVPEENRSEEILKLESLIPESASATSSVRHITPNGMEVILEWTYTAIFDATGRLIEFQTSGQNVTENIWIKDEPVRYARLQGFLRSIALKYINIPLSNIDETIEESLAEIGEFAGADRSYIFDYDWKNNVCNNTFEWCKSGIEPQKEALQNVPMDSIEYWVTTHKSGRMMEIHDVFELQEADTVRQILEPQGVKSLIAIPIVDGDLCMGFIGFDSVLQPHHYSDSEKMLLQVFAQMIANIQKRRVMELDLIASRKKAEESDKLKSAFLANMSHEIRTPMNGIIGFTELLKTPGIEKTEQEIFISLIEASGIRMLNTLNDIIDMSKIEAGIMDIHREEVDLKMLINELLTFFRPEATKKGLKIASKIQSLGSLKRCYTDKNKLYSILSNLINNAIKFTPEGLIEVGFSCTRQEYEFYVKDTGIGIDETFRGLVFNRFMQADISMTRGHEGSGLGLAISKAYVENLSGRIWVQSRVGEGSVFRFTLPVF